MSATTVLAHGVGGRADLPLPLPLVAYGAAAVLVISFVVLGMRWRETRLEDGVAGVLLPGRVGRAVQGLGVVGRVVGLGLALLVPAVAFTGPPSTTQNLAPFAVFVTLWVGGLLASGLVADVWGSLSPFETVRRAVTRATASETRSRLEPLDRIGHWPAAGLLLAFTWLELVHPNPGDPRTVGLAIAVYVAVIAAGAAWYGPRWIASAELFGVLFSILAAMAPLHRDEQGRLRLRAPLGGLPRLRVVPGTSAVVLVALGTTTFDGVTRLQAWQDLLGGRSGWAAAPLATVGLLATVGVVAGLYAWSMREASRSTGRPTRELVDGFVHSLVPIALAYATAHYFSLLVFEGQRFLILLSDPWSRGWDLFGTGDWAVSYTALSPRVISVVQAASIVVGHLAGVLLAHDRAVARFPGDLATRSQYPLLVAMVAYTVGGLFLLLGA